jgi:hypothetical protein
MRVSLIVYAVPSAGPELDAVLLTHPAALAYAFAARPAVEGGDIYRESNARSSAVE